MIGSKAWKPVKALAECNEPGVHSTPNKKQNIARIF